MDQNLLIGASFIAAKKLELGTFTTNEIDILEVHQDVLEFKFKGRSATEEVVLKRTDISKVEALFDENNHFIRITLRPAKAKEISSQVPKDFTFTFYSSENNENVFKLHFHEELEDQWKTFFSNFYCAPEVDAKEALDVEDDAGKEKCELMQVGAADGPPAKKKKKTPSHENYATGRTLRSQTQPRPSRPAEVYDFYCDDDSIPEEFRKLVEEKPARMSSPSPFGRFENTTELLKYQTNSGSEIIIRMEDFKCLDRRELISDVVIDFYLQYLYKQVFSEEQRSKVHIYTTHFYRYLATQSNYAGWNDKEIKALTAAEKRYQRVRDFPCNNVVNVFEKDFIVFPCINNEHWFLAIACFPSLNGAYSIDTGEFMTPDEATKDSRYPDSGRPAKVSCILVFDSVKANIGRKISAITHIRNFLLWEHKIKYHDKLEFDYREVRGMSPKCPQQSNATDCGLFVLQFFEHFFIHSPFTDFRFPVDASDWFNPNIIFGKREHIANVIKDLMKPEYPDGVLPELPDISFTADVQATKVDSGNNNEISESNNNNNNEISESNNNNNNEISENNNNNCDNNNQEEFNNNNDFYTGNNNLLSNQMTVTAISSNEDEYSVPETSSHNQNLEQGLNNGFHSKDQLCNRRKTEERKSREVPLDDMIHTHSESMDCDYIDELPKNSEEEKSEGSLENESIDLVENVSLHSSTSGNEKTAGPPAETEMRNEDDEADAVIVIDSD